MSEKDRRSEGPGVLRMSNLIREARWKAYSKDYGEWGVEPSLENLRAVSAAVVVCCGTKDIAEHCSNIDDLIALAREFRLTTINELPDALLKIHPLRIREVQSLIVAGLAARPATDDYVIGLIAMPRTLHGATALAARISEDAGLKPVLLRIMEIEGTSEFSLAAVDKYAKAGNTWVSILLSMCKSGDYSRETLLDKTLSALENDWLQFRSGWFSRFHGELSPTADEMTPHARRYLALCRSRNPPTVAMALAALKALDAAGALDASAFLEALRPVMSSAVKSQVDAALKMLDALVQREPSCSPDAAQLIAIGLSHESADVQKNILRRLGKWGVDDGLRERLRELVPLVAAVNRDELEKLCGIEAKATGPGAAAAATATEDAAHVASAAVAPSERVSALHPSRRLAPITSLDELVERLAYVLEHDTDIDEFERVVGALVQAAPLPVEQVDRFIPVIKRATRVSKPLGRALAQLLAYVTVGTEIDNEIPPDRKNDVPAAHVALYARMRDLAEVAAQAKGLVPLSTPTHQRGFIDPALFVERVAEHQRHNLRSPVSEQIAALLRLAPLATLETRSRARVLHDNAFTRALRHALGDDDVISDERDELFAATRLIRNRTSDDCYTWRVTARSNTVDGRTYTHYIFAITSHRSVDGLPARMAAVLRVPPPDAADRPWHTRWRFNGTDEGAIRYSATLLPSDPAPFFADAAEIIANNLDWWEAQWQNKAYLDLLLDPTVELTPMATLVLALGLAGKEPGQTALCIDALASAWTGNAAHSRLDATALGSAIRDLLAKNLVKAARYSKSLRASLRINPGLGTPLVEILGIALEARPENPPKDAAMLLELLQEVLIANRFPLPDRVRRTIENLKMGGKGRTLQKALLG